MNILKLILPALSAFTLQAGELGPDVEAKFIKAIIASSGSNKVACTDAALKVALEAQGVVVDASAAIVWSTNALDAKMMKASGRLVVTNKRELAANACVLVQEEGGRPKIFLNTINLKAARVQLGDAVLKIAEKI